MQEILDFWFVEADSSQWFRGGASFDRQCWRYARQHCEIIERFGRFPHRNAVLGRQNTAEEAAWLADHGNPFA